MKQKLPSTAVGRRRLLKLAGLLEKDAANKKGIKFDLEVLAAHSNPVQDSVWGERSKFVKGEVPTLDCGTAACAVGLAAISGEFKREGFTYRINECWGIEPRYKRHSGFGEADRRFFEITEGEIWFLFHQDYYEKPAKGARGELMVAKRIRDFVAGKAKPADL